MADAPKTPAEQSAFPVTGQVPAATQPKAEAPQVNVAPSSSSRASLHTCRRARTRIKPTTDARICTSASQRQGKIDW